MAFLWYSVCMVKMNTVQDEINQIAQAEADAKDERDLASLMATDEWTVLMAEIEAENWAWWQAQM
jgi:hypothetical protein